MKGYCLENFVTHEGEYASLRDYHKWCLCFEIAIRTFTFAVAESRVVGQQSMIAFEKKMTGSRHCKRQKMTILDVCTAEC